jgi:hypothetical protein
MNTVRRLRPATWLLTGLLFSGALLAGSVAESAGPAGTGAAWRAWASTNLDNLRHHPVPAIAVSPFLPDGYAWLWVALSLIGLAAVGRVLGAGRTAILALAAHVLATLASEGILAVRIASGAAPPEARHVVDVGPSYVVVAALVAAVAYGTWPGRLASAAAFAVIAPHLFTGLDDWGVAETGHGCAVVIGLALGFVLRRHRAGGAGRIASVRHRSDSSDSSTDS